MFSNGYPYTDFHELNLDWIVKHFKEFVNELGKLEEWKSSHENEYQDLKNFMEDLENGNIPPAMYAEIYKWIQKNLFDIVGNMIKFITPYLDNTGHICLKYPPQWNVLVFNTTEMDITTPLQPEYGHLTISY